MYIVNTAWKYVGEDYGMRGGVYHMAKVNRNLLAKELAKHEGLREEMSIGQIKELLNVIFTHHNLEEVVEIWQAYNKR